VTRFSTHLRQFRPASCSPSTCASACSPASARVAEPIGSKNPGQSRLNPSSTVRFTLASAARTASDGDRSRRRCNRTPLWRFRPLQRLPVAMRCPGRPSLRTIPLRRLFPGLRSARPRIFARRRRPCGFSLLGCDAVVLDVRTITVCGFAAFLAAA